MIKNNIIVQFILILVVAFFSGCQIDEYENNNPQLVVEGWIDSDDYPVVIVSTTIPISKQRRELSEIKDYIIRWAKVTVSDGEQNVILTGKVSKGYFPSYIYTTSRLKGMVGKKYRLTVDFENFHAEAETTIPEPQKLDSIRVYPCSSVDSLYEVHAFFNIVPGDKRYYKFFTCIGHQSRIFLSSYMQTISSETVKECEQLDVSVYRGRLVTNSKSYVPYFSASDTVLVKFATMEYQAFLFWSQMERNVTFGKLPMYSVNNHTNFNIHGGLGYWFGYGVNIYNLVIADSIDVQ